MHVFLSRAWWLKSCCSKSRAGYITFTYSCPNGAVTRASRLARGANVAFEEIGLRDKRTEWQVKCYLLPFFFFFLFYVFFLPKVCYVLCFQHPPRGYETSPRGSSGWRGWISYLIGSSLVRQRPERAPGSRGQHSSKELNTRNKGKVRHSLSVLLLLFYLRFLIFSLFSLTSSSRLWGKIPGEFKREIGSREGSRINQIVPRGSWGSRGLVLRNC